MSRRHGFLRRKASPVLLTALALGTALPVLLLHWGCNGSASPSAPVAPFRGSSLSFSFPVSREIRSSLLNVSSNEVYYNVTGPNMTPVTGVAGPYNTNASVGSGELDIQIPSVPQGSSRLLAFQLNNAANHQPLAIGAVLTDLNSGGVSDIFVTIGTLVSNCYTVDTSAYFQPGPASSAGVSSVYFTFDSDLLSTTVPGDIAVTAVGGGFSLAPQPPNQIAYMGNGPLVNFASVPASFTGGPSAALNAGDVYCVSLGTGGANGHAWLQVANPNATFNVNTPTPAFPKSFATGPKFVFRVNHSLAYFAYDQTAADQGGSCLVPIPTYTYIPTNTFTSTSSPTPTNSPTQTYSPTITDTPTSTDTATITPTPSSPTATYTSTITNTPTNSPSLTPSFTPTNTPAVGSPTATFTPSSTITSTYTFSPTATFVAGYSVTSSIAPLVTDAGNNNAWQSFILTINATSNGNPAVSYAQVTDPASGYYVWVGPWSYTGNSTSFSVTLTGGDFFLSSPVSTSLSVALYNGTQSQLLASCVPTGSPATIEEPSEFFYYYDGYYGYNTLGCATTAEDGNCQGVSFYSYLEVPGSNPVTSLIQLIDLSNSVTAFLGPVTTTSYNYETWYLSPAQLGVTVVGQKALGQTILAQLVDANTQAVYDQRPLGTVNLEYPSAAYIASSNISILQTDPNNGACQRFVLNIDANAPAGVEETSYAAVTDMANGYYVWVGPFSYTGTGSSFSVTLVGGDLGITTPTVSSLRVLLYADNKTQLLDSVAPAGSPLTLESPEEYFDYYDSYYGYNELGCATTAGDGNCQAVSFYSDLTTPASVPVTSLIELINLSGSVTAFLGPVTGTGGGDTWYLSPAQLGVTVVGQQAVSQTILAQLVDANTQAVYDQRPLGTVNLEYPSSAYIASSNISVLQTDPNNGACQRFVLTIDANAPAGVEETGYAAVTDTANGYYTWVGPFSYTGTGSSFSVTLVGGDLGITTPTVSSLRVLLYNQAQNQVLDSAAPAGSPLTLESPEEYFYYYDGYYGYNDLSCATTAGDGNCQAFSFYSYLAAPGSLPVTSLIELIDLSNSVTAFLGPVTGVGSSGTWYLSATQFGVTVAGQQAMSQTILAQLVDANTQAVLDERPLGTLNLEYPSADYIASSNISVLQTDPNNGACQRFVLTIDANAPAGVEETGYAAVTDTANGYYTWVGPFSYTGTGSSFSVTLVGGDLGITTPAATSLRVLLYNQAQNQVLDSAAPAGSPLTLESPEEYFYYYDGYYGYNELGCATTAGDGNCQAVSFYSYLEVPGSNPVTSLIQLINLSNGVTAFLGPVTAVNNAYGTWYLSATQFGVTVVGQQAMGQTILAQLVDANTQAVLDEKPQGTFNLEFPSQAYIASSSVSAAVTTATGCQQFVLTVNPNAPVGIPETSYIVVEDVTNGSSVTQGPFSYTGSGNSFPITLTGGEFGLTGPVTTALRVLLYNQAMGQVQDSSTPSGTPLVLEPPPVGFYSSYPYLSCQGTGEDGYCETFQLSTELYNSQAAPATCYVKVTDTSNGASMILGPVTFTGQGYAYPSYPLSSSEFGINAGQSAVSQIFQAKVLDSTQTVVYDVKPIGTYSLESP